MSLIFIAFALPLLLAAYLLTRPSRKLQLLGVAMGFLVISGAALFLLGNMYFETEAELYEYSPDGARVPVSAPD